MAKNGKLPGGEFDIWNERSPLVRIIAHQYERAGMHTWNNDRLSALARGLGKTIWVICAHAGYFKLFYDPTHDLFRINIDRAAIRKHWEANHWPVWATLHFERFEHFLKTKRMEPGAVLLGVADATAVKVLES
jgi:hypothetical protein